MPAAAVTERDCWARWLLERRFADDPEDRRRWAGWLGAVRDRLLDAAELRAGETLLDVGCGDGLIAFGALERGAAHVVFTDISRDLLDECRRLADELGALDRCRFLLASAEDLAAIEDESIDVVTTRSVLIYVDDKERAFREFHRVLRPGGRVSVFEPINRLNRFFTYDVEPVRDLAERVKAVFERLQPRDTDPMLDFDDRDLVELAERAGFERVRLTLEVEIEPPEPVAWETFARVPGNPRIPSLEEALEQALSPEERERYVSHLRPLVETGRGCRRMASAYVLAVKESSTGNVARASRQSAA